MPTDFWIVLAAALTVAFVPVVMSFVWLRKAIYWRQKAYDLEREANRSADEAARLEGVVAQNLRDLDDKDFQIGRLTAERDTARRHADGMARQLSRPVEAVVAWNAANPTRTIKGVAGLVERAFVSGPNGRLVRLVPEGADRWLSTTRTISSIISRATSAVGLARRPTL